MVLDNDFSSVRIFSTLKLFFLWLLTHFVHKNIFSKYSVTKILYFLLAENIENLTFHAVMIWVGGLTLPNKQMTTNSSTLWLVNLTDIFKLKDHNLHLACKIYHETCGFTYIGEANKEWTFDHLTSSSSYLTHHLIWYRSTLIPTIQFNL